MHLKGRICWRCHSILLLSSDCAAPREVAQAEGRIQTVVAVCDLMGPHCVLQVGRVFVQVKYIQCRIQIVAAIRDL